MKLLLYAELRRSPSLLQRTRLVRQLMTECRSQSRERLHNKADTTSTAYIPVCNYPPNEVIAGLQVWQELHLFVPHLLIRSCLAMQNSTLDSYP